MSRHITSLVINSLGGGHTHMHTDVRTETISRNQVRAGLRVPGLNIVHNSLKNTQSC